MIADRSFDRHNQLTDPFTGRQPPGRRGPRRSGPRQRRLHAPPPRHPPAPPAAPPQRLPLPLLRRPPLQRRAAGPDRHRQRADAEAGATESGAARARGAGRGDRRLRRRGGRIRRAAQRPPPRRPGRRRLQNLRRSADAVPGGLGTGPGSNPGAARAAPPPGLDEARFAHARSHLDDLDRRPLQDDLADQRHGPSTPPAPTPSRGSARPRPGRSSTAPASPTRCTCTTPTGTCWRATASRRPPGKTASRRPSSSTRANGSSSPATSPTTPASSSIHCHMLDHEDHGLMSQFEVV